LRTDASGGRSLLVSLSLRRKDLLGPVTSVKKKQEPRTRGSQPVSPTATQVHLHVKRYTVHPTRYTLHATPYTLHHTPCTIHPTYTLHPTPYTLHPAPCLHPTYTLHPTPYALHPTPYIHPTPYTMSPDPYTDLEDSGSEAGSYLKLIDSCITQLKAQGPSS